MLGPALGGGVTGLVGGVNGPPTTKTILVVSGTVDPALWTWLMTCL